MYSIYIPVSAPQSSQWPLMQNFPSFHTALLCEGRTPPLGNDAQNYPTAVLGASSPTEASQCGSFWRTGPIDRQTTESSDSPCSSCKETSMTNKLLICDISAGSTVQASAYSLVGDSVSGNSQGWRLIDSVGLPVDSLSSSCPLVHLPILP